MLGFRLNLPLHTKVRLWDQHFEDQRRCFSVGYNLKCRDTSSKRAIRGLMAPGLRHALNLMILRGIRSKVLGEGLESYELLDAETLEA